MSTKVRPFTIASRAIRLYRDRFHEGRPLLEADRELRPQLARAVLVEDRPAVAIWRAPRGVLLIVDPHGVVVGVVGVLEECRRRDSNAH